MVAGWLWRQVKYECGVAAGCSPGSTLSTKPFTNVHAAVNTGVNEAGLGVGRELCRKGVVAKGFQQQPPC